MGVGNRYHRVATSPGRRRVGWLSAVIVLVGLMLPVWPAGAATTTTTTTTCSPSTATSTATATGGSVTAMTGSTAAANPSSHPGASDPTTRSHGDLAFTGADVTSAVLVAVLLITGGLVLVRASRRRRSSRPGANGPASVLIAVVVAQSLLPRSPHSLASTCAPVSVLPESQLTILLPLFAVLVLGGVLVAARRGAAADA